MYEEISYFLSLPFTLLVVIGRHDHCTIVEKPKETYRCVCQSLCRVQLFAPHGLWPARLLCPWNSPVRNFGVGCHSRLQGIFPTQGLNLGIQHCRQILYQLSHQESMRRFSIFTISPFHLTCCRMKIWSFNHSQKAKRNLEKLTQYSLILLSRWDNFENTYLYTSCNGRYLNVLSHC